MSKKTLERIGKLESQANRRINSQVSSNSKAGEFEAALNQIATENSAEFVEGLIASLDFPTQPLPHYEGNGGFSDEELDGILRESLALQLNVALARKQHPPEPNSENSAVEVTA